VLWRLLGGPTRTEIPTHVSVGYVVEDLGKVRERAMRYKEIGFSVQKWFIRHGPASGHEGMKLDVGMVRTLRESLGDDYDIMIDCWQGLNFDYAAALTEECFMPDRIDNYVKLKAKTRIPLLGAEHEYTRWDSSAILQPDPYWCGGLSETMKIDHSVAINTLAPYMLTILIEIPVAWYI
jgi:L-alanine-DL-glutamate epimerase-like enolase superfamily enzyme